MPKIMMPAAFRPAPRHSPVAAPSVLEVPILIDMRIGQPTEGPRRPSLFAPAPYPTKTPSHIRAINKAKQKYGRVFFRYFTQLCFLDMRRP